MSVSQTAFPGVYGETKVILSIIWIFLVHIFYLKQPMHYSKCEVVLHLVFGPNCTIYRQNDPGLYAK